MKFTTIALITASFCGAAFANPAVQEDTPSTLTDVPISVSVICNVKIDWSNLMLPQMTKVASILAESYNAIHAMENNDDSVLTDLVFSGGKRRMFDVEGDEANLESWSKSRPKKGTHPHIPFFFAYRYDIVLTIITMIVVYDFLCFRQQVSGPVSGDVPSVRMMTLRIPVVQS
jgi:hypothetical protein